MQQKSTGNFMDNENGKKFHLTLNGIDRERLRFLRGVFEKKYGENISLTAAIRAAIRRLSDDAGFATHE
jgi:hypothetical protein